MYIRLGNPNLESSDKYSINGRFIRHELTSGFSLFSYISYSYTENSIISSQFTDELGIRTSTYENYGNSNNISASISFRNRLEILGVRYSIRINGRNSNYSTKINDEINKTNSKNGTLGFSLNNDKKEKLDAAIGASWNINYTTYSSANNSDRNDLKQTYYIKSDWDISERFNFNTQFNYSIFSGSKFGTDQAVPIWNASISYSFLKAKSLNLRIRALDILNKSIGLVKKSSDNYYIETQREVLGTYYMLYLTYNLNGNKNPNAKKGRKHFKGIN